MAAPSLVRNHTASATSGTTLTVAVTQAAAGNLLVASVVFRDISPESAITPPTGWTQQTSHYTAFHKQAIFTRIAGASEPTSYAFEIGETISAAVLIYSEWTGASDSVPVQAAGSTLIGSGIAGIDAPQLTATTPDTIVYMSATTIGNYTITRPSSSILIAEAASGTTDAHRRCMAAYYEFDGPGPTPTENAYDYWQPSGTATSMLVGALVIGPAFSIVPLTVHHMRQMGMA